MSSSQKSVPQRHESDNPARSTMDGGEAESRPSRVQPSLRVVQRRAQPIPGRPEEANIDSKFSYSSTVLKNNHPHTHCLPCNAESPPPVGAWLPCPSHPFPCLPASITEDKNGPRNSPGKGHGPIYQRPFFPGKAMLIPMLIPMLIGRRAMRPGRRVEACGGMRVMRGQCGGERSHSRPLHVGVLIFSTF
ncbi:unnamed protein product [Darwinula stevensoni]|uniref:Uncharacterized protein n=1 Tax=Darwinula stevensoni TaxID=69355 RepID=A0A7R8X3A8_9CRUS|nr:unnamed protein product [Darwinula stevensoni]CAG0878522.1 unnamed protein product [Darwinula stevensoni]